MFDFDSFQHQCRELVHAEMIRGREESNAIEVMLVRIYQHCEGALEHWQEGVERQPLACGPGCGTCCAINVAVLLPEAMVIAQYLRQQFSEKMQGELKEKLIKLSGEVRWLDEDERLFLRRSCAFLDDRENCVIWPQRPLMCRAITSTDAQACQEALVAPVFGEVRLVVMNLVQKQIFECAFKAMAEALRDLGYDARSFKLSCAVSAFCCEPEHAARFLRGELFSPSG